MSEEIFEEAEEELAITDKQKEITDKQKEKIESLKQTLNVKVEGYIMKTFKKSDLRQLTFDEAEKLLAALSDYAKKKGYREVKNYIIKKDPEIQDLFEVKKENGTTYLVNPVEGLCDCPDMRFRAKTKCKHIDMVLDIFPEIKKELEEKEKAREAVTEKIMQDFVPIDRWSKEEILKQLTDEIIQKYYVYDFEQEGRRVVGLTADCVIDIAHWIGGIETVDEHVFEMGDKVVAKVTVRDVTRDFTVSGFAEESKWFDAGKKKPKRFAERIAFRKAQRNALKRLIPKFVEETILQKYEEIKEKETIKNV